VTAAVFAEPFPLLICGDSAGFLSAFLVRPYDATSTANGSSNGIKQYTRLLRWRNKPKHVWDLSPEEMDAKEETKQAAKLAR
jgi:hypothetical protein